MAMESGLSAAIINPNSEAMMRAYYSFNALMNLDPQCSEYISIYSGQTAGLGQTIGKGGNGAGGLGTAGNGGAGAGSLGNAIERGLKEVAVESVTALLKEKEALDVINEEIIPALDHVGKGFEKGTVFLPQLLMSAEAAKAAFEVIKNAMAGSGETQEKKGTIILATVKGDIHDIGKNIVKVLLENYSYDVIDLGKDVPPETVVEEAVNRHAPLVGLSALMTTTVPSMEETIKQLRESAPWVKVMVGGAVLTQEYADTIDADAYCKDAMASVHYAETIF
jgi:5-methyltetrahydrofolate--homocysteine methyltransferase